MRGASPGAFIGWVLLLTVIVVSLDDVAPSFGQLVDGVPSMLSLLDRMIPHNTESAFLDRIFSNSICVAPEALFIFITMGSK